MKNGAFVFLFRDDSRQEVYLVYRSDWPVWNITGGGIEEGETPKEAAEREAYEETGFKVKIGGLLGKRVRFRDKSRSKVLYTAYYHEGRIISGTFKPEFPGCKGKWFNVNHLPTDFIDTDRKLVQQAVRFNNIEQTIIQPYYPRDLLILLRHPLTGIRYFRPKPKPK